MERKCCDENLRHWLLDVNFFSVWFERNLMGKMLNAHNFFVFLSSCDLGLCFCVFMFKYESMYFYVFNFFFNFVKIDKLILKKKSNADVGSVWIQFIFAEN